MANINDFSSNYFDGDIVDDKSKKDYHTTLLLNFFLGIFGAHRFYAGKIGTGLAMLFTCGGCGLWKLYDLIIILTGNFKDVDGLNIKSNNSFWKTWSNVVVVVMLAFSMLLSLISVFFYTSQLSNSVNNMDSSIYESGTIEDTSYTSENTVVKEGSYTEKHLDDTGATYSYDVSNSLIYTNSNSNYFAYTYTLSGDEIDVDMIYDIDRSNFNYATIPSEPYYLQVVALYEENSDNVAQYCDESSSIAETVLIDKKSDKSCHVVYTYEDEGQIIYEAVEYTYFKEFNSLLSITHVGINITEDDFMEIFYASQGTSSVEK